MADLASCYFCGVALDEPVTVKSVVPTELAGPDTDAPTVALCPTCEEKLTAVTDAIVEAVAVGDDSTTATPDAGPDPLEPATDELIDPETGASESAASETATTETREETADPGSSASGDGEPDTATSGDDEDEAPGEPASAADGESGTGETVTGESGTDESGTDKVGTDETGTDETGTDEAESGGDPTDRSVVEGDHSISALEYNKVMRLLQNREFPVDRDEIVTVAASAYQVSRADCDRVIDVAIDRGLIDEAEGKLVRPE